MLVVVIGLPGSGKSTLCKSRFKDFIIFDDDYNNKKIKKYLSEGKNVCVNHPDLCNYKIYQNFVHQFQDTEIKTICFEKNIEECDYNRNWRDDPLFDYDDYFKEISNEYNIINYKPDEIIPVYVMNKDKSIEKIEVIIFILIGLFLISFIL